jgi:hypothetical protein
MEAFMAVGNLPIGTAKAITSSTQISTSQGQLLGFLIGTSSSLTLAAIDSATSSGGTSLLATTAAITAPLWLPCPVAFANGLYVTVGGTGTVTVVYN